MRRGLNAAVTARQIRVTFRDWAPARNSRPATRHAEATEAARVVVRRRRARRAVAAAPTDDREVRRVGLAGLRTASNRDAYDL